MSKQPRNIIALPDLSYPSWEKDGTVDIDLDDLEVTADYEAELYHPLLLKARRHYMQNPDDDVHNEYNAEAILTLLNIVRDLNKRVKQLEAVIDLVPTDQEATEDTSKESR